VTKHIQWNWHSLNGNDWFPMYGSDAPGTVTGSMEGSCSPWYGGGGAVDDVAIGTPTIDGSVAGRDVLASDVDDDDVIGCCCWPRMAGPGWDHVGVGIAAARGHRAVGAR